MHGSKLHHAVTDGPDVPKSSLAIALQITPYHHSHRHPLERMVGQRESKPANLRLQLVCTRLRPEGHCHVLHRFTRGAACRALAGHFLLMRTDRWERSHLAGKLRTGTSQPSPSRSPSPSSMGRYGYHIALRFHSHLTSRSQCRQMQKSMWQCFHFHVLGPSSISTAPAAWKSTTSLLPL